MIPPQGHILVVGHRNPDTDASTSAWAYARFLRESRAYDTPVMAVIAGELPPQSRYVFERAGVPLPPVVPDLLPRVCDVVTRDARTLSTEDRFGDAVELLIRSNKSMLPVVGPDGKLHSVFSHRRDTSRFLLGFDVLPLLSRLLDWRDLLALPGARALGSIPSEPALTGQVRLALAGKRFGEEVGREDLLVCSDLSAVMELPEEKFPRWIVLAGEGAEAGAPAVMAANRRGSYLLSYQNSALDFLFALQAQVRVGSLDLDTGSCVGEFDLLQDVREIVAAARHSIPVVNPAGALVGVVSRADLSAPPRRRVILIDHFESGQVIPGIENAEILEIVDHHRVGDLETKQPIRVECRPLGSSCTIIAERYLEGGIEVDRSTATLLLGGIVSDTLCLRSPTTTPTDRKAAARLASLIGTTVEQFGREVLVAGDDLLTSDPAEIWNRDRKVFGICNHHFSVAQLETVSLEDLPVDRLAAFRDLVAADFEKSSYLVSLLFLTSVLTGDSWVTCLESERARGVTAACFGAHEPRPGWTLAKGIVSRKKQIAPKLLQALSERRL
jgi:manganese-dependent inorganic pyrophosphatase